MTGSPFAPDFAPAFGAPAPVAGTPSPFPDPPELADLKAWLGLDAADTADDAVLTVALNAACRAQAMVVDYPLEADTLVPVLTDDLENALFLRAQRLAARRNSPEGVVGFSDQTGDFVAARVPSGDYDVVRLEGPYLKIPVA